MGACPWPRHAKANAPAPAPAPAPPRLLLLALALCSLLAQPHPSRAFFFGVRTSAHVRPHQQRQPGGGREEKVPMTVVVPDYSPRPAPTLGPTPSAAPAPAPVRGSDGGGGGDDEDGTPRLPSERRNSGAPSSADHSASAQAPAGGATSTDFISSSPAVPLPAGVTDSATVLPMPAPGQQLRDDVGMGTLRLQVLAVQQLAVPLLVMLSFGFGAS